MLGKTTTPSLPVGKFEPSDDKNNPLEDGSFAQAIQRAEDGLSELGYQGVDGEPDVVIVLRQTRNRLGPDKMVVGTIYAGPLDINLITEDLKRPL